MRGNKKKQKSSSPTLKTLMCGVVAVMYMLFNMEANYVPPAKEVKKDKIAEKVITKSVHLYDASGNDINAPQAKYKVKKVKTKKLNNIQVAENKEEEKYMTWLLYGTEAEYQEAKTWFANKKPTYIEANKLMARK